MAFFYVPVLDRTQSSMVLEEATSKHMVQVLRMQNGEEVHLTNGQGRIARATITDNHRKQCRVQIIHFTEQPGPIPHVTLAVSMIKNTSRWEWLLEKATEIGVQRIVPLVCQRTEKTNFKADRMQGILISAMLQSQQCWLPELTAPVKFGQWLPGDAADTKYIAHCISGSEKSQLADQVRQSAKHRLILIGPEGDFTPEEIQLALAAGYTPVSLGQSRLRTETAAIVAAAWMVTAQ
jgi:16S rRNA (uracil1498-N3)-methyltransferase